MLKKRVFLLVMLMLVMSTTSFSNILITQDSLVIDTWSGVWNDTVQVQTNATLYAGGGYSTLTLSDGIFVSFEGDYSLTIAGGLTFDATGTANQPITFTSAGTMTTPDTAEAGDWGSIKFDGAAGNYARGSFEYCIFEFGGNTHVSHAANGPLAGMDHAVINVSNSTFHHHLGPVVGSGNSTDWTVQINFLNNLAYQCEVGVYHMSPHEDSTQYIVGNTFLAMSHATEGVGVFIQDFASPQDDTLIGNFAVVNNLIANSASDGIYGFTCGALIKNNTIVHAGDDGINITSVSGAASPVINNNTIYDASNYGIYCLDGTGVTVTHSCVNGSGNGNYNGNVTFGGTNTTSDPEMALPLASVDDPGDTFDYHLLWNSPCLHAGDSTAAADTNRNGTRVDMGFYGGPDAPDDYYLAVQDTLGDGDTFREDLGSPLRVTADVVILSGGSRPEVWWKLSSTVRVVEYQAASR